jgi:hypothetical protein
MPAFMVPERSQRILLTEIDLDIAALPGSAVRIIDELVESLDTSEIEARKRITISLPMSAVLFFIQRRS